MPKRRYKAYKIKVVLTKTMWVYEDEFEKECREDGIPQEFNETTATNYVKGTLIEETYNKPWKGSSTVLDAITYTLKNEKDA